MYQLGFTERVALSIVPNEKLRDLLELIIKNAYLTGKQDAREESFRCKVDNTGRELQEL